MFYGLKIGTMITWLAVVVLSIGPASATHCASIQAGVTPTLVVQVVDDSWLPLPGAVVRARLRGGSRGECMTGVANMDGVVPLRPSSPGLYDLEASMLGFKPKRVRRIRVDADASQSIPRVQIKLKLAGGEMVD